MLYLFFMLLLFFRDIFFLYSTNLFYRKRNYKINPKVYSNQDQFCTQFIGHLQLIKLFKFLKLVISYTLLAQYQFQLIINLGLTGCLYQFLQNQQINSNCIQKLTLKINIRLFSYITFLFKIGFNMDPNNQKRQNQAYKQDSEPVFFAKKQEQPSDVITCQKCTKIFMNQPAYHSHVKTKHSEDAQKNQKEQSEDVPLNEYSKLERSVEKKPIKKIPFKNRMMEIQQNQLEDTIYAFLGELGEKNAEPISNRSEFILHNENQRLTGQTNYSLNKVVRTPYEQPIKASQNIPNQQIEKSAYKQFLNILRKQLKQLEDKVEAQKQIWELRDPMAPEEQTQDQFSLMDIRKLIINYPKRNLSLKYPHFSIYMLWIARICKPPAFKQFFMVIGTFLAKFESLPEHKSKQENCYEVWKNYSKNNQAKLVEKQLIDKLQICDQKNSKKFIEYFVEWTTSFRAMVIGH